MVLEGGGARAWPQAPPEGVLVETQRRVVVEHGAVGHRPRIHGLGRRQGVPGVDVDGALLHHAYDLHDEGGHGGADGGGADQGERALAAPPGDGGHGGGEDAPGQRPSRGGVVAPRSPGHQ